VSCRRFVVLVPEAAKSAATILTVVRALDEVAKRPDALPMRVVSMIAGIDTTTVRLDRDVRSWRVVVR
jgi:hypothetical protein